MEIPVVASTVGGMENAATACYQKAQGKGSRVSSCCGGYYILNDANEVLSFSLLRPILEERLEAMKDPKFKPPPDLIQLVIDGSPDGKGHTLDYQVNAQVGTGRAALFTTAVTVFHILYDLCVRSEYIAPLREEALEVGEVSMTRPNVAKLAKLDSFIREAQRFNKFMLGRASFYKHTNCRADHNSQSALSGRRRSR